MKARRSTWGLLFLESEGTETGWGGGLSALHPEGCEELGWLPLGLSQQGDNAPRELGVVMVCGHQAPRL